MNNFKFFKGTLNMMEVGETFITASFNDDTPEGHMRRRRLYHTDRNLYEMSQEEILRRRHEAFERNGYYGDNRNFFSPVTVTKVKETFWTKFKDVMRESWRSEPVGIVFVGVLTTLIVIVGIAKLLGL